MSTEVFFFIYCLFVFCFFYQKAKYQKNAQLQNSVVLGAETFAELIFSTLQKLYLFQVLKPHENKLDGY